MVVRSDVRGKNVLITTFLCGARVARGNSISDMVASSPPDGLHALVLFSLSR
jgi:hypothetical protein